MRKTAQGRKRRHVRKCNLLAASTAGNKLIRHRLAAASSLSPWSVPSVAYPTASAHSARPSVHCGSGVTFAGATRGSLFASCATLTTGPRLSAARSAVPTAQSRLRNPAKIQRCDELHRSLILYLRFAGGRSQRFTRPHEGATHCPTSLSEERMVDDTKLISETRLSAGYRCFREQPR
jgi:hypothetical protein